MELSLRSRALWVTSITLLCIGCDQATKLAARSWLAVGEVDAFLGDTVRLQLAANYGAFLSLGDGLPPRWRTWLLSAGVGCVLLGVLWYALMGRALQRRWVLALALIFGGGLSNWLDRLRLGGYVVDFINLGIGPVRTGIFNFADVALTSGALLMLYWSWRERSGPRIAS